jgi:aspartate aminotransferase-like enzyme
VLFLVRGGDEQRIVYVATWIDRYESLAKCEKHFDTTLTVDTIAGDGCCPMHMIDCHDDGKQ